MSKKSKKGGGKKATAEADAPPDQFDQMDSDQLKTAIVEMTARLKQIKQQRISQQVERDQLQQFLDIAHSEVVDKEGAIELIEYEMEKKQDTHQNDIRWYMSKVTHLELEHQASIQAIEQENESNLQGEQARSDTRREQLRQQKLELEAKLREDSLAHEQSIRNLLVLQQKEMRKLNQEFDRQSNQLSTRYQTKLAQLKSDLELQRKMEIHEIQERKNLHINDLMRNHEKSFNEMRDYYNSITRDNLALINSLKEELAELKSKAVVNQRVIEEIQQENKKLTEPLSHTESELKDLKSKLSNYMKEKRSLKLAKTRSAQFESQLKREQAAMDTLRCAFKDVEADRDRLYNQFESVVREMQTKSTAKAVELEKQVDLLIERYTRKTSQFGEVISAANLDGQVVNELTTKLDAVLDSKNSQIGSLQSQIARASKAHDDLIRVYNAKLPEMGVPVKDISMSFLLEPPGASS